MFLYLHGFNSAPSSLKAQQAKDYLAEHYPNEPYAFPQLATTPDEVKAQIVPLASAALEAGEPLRLMGSSMGGFFCTYLLENLTTKYPQTEITAVLINPAVNPWALMDDILGEHTNPYTNEVFQVEHQHAEQLELMNTANIRHHGAYRVLLQSGDEVLDYRLAVAKYGQSQLHIEPGGDHSYQNFAAQLPQAFAFLGLA
ncbi:YqiA/YcfP family alpha/beta fold hydrolase [Ferrimonas lipolytica]|uniref:Esterase YqiA n=1 Tax=Ferrimonas lipolytica TaxID=2724191 RepID=A0A6H1UIZ5_9GAMM|nr:YqiA/YcfP family alpha/beta fold hydrolase [Ferrimonas lipolytica]QIZ77772.1 esterase YqiA [Ferrimonas lipolytica]